MGEGVNVFQSFPEMGRGEFEEFYCREGAWREKGSQFLELAIINFSSRLLLDLLFTCCLKDVASFLIFQLFLAYFVL